MRLVLEGGRSNLKKLSTPSDTLIAIQLFIAMTDE
jgi:hypothetical protein